MADVLRTVVVVDDHAEFRSSARALLDADGFDVVGEAGTGAEAIRVVNSLRPRRRRPGGACADR